MTCIGVDAIGGTGEDLTAAMDAVVDGEEVFSTVELGDEVFVGGEGAVVGSPETLPEEGL